MLNEPTMDKLKALKLDAMAVGLGRATEIRRHRQARL